jgi:hypothetical protein
VLSLIRKIKHPTVAVLLAMAEAWLDLADRAHRLARHFPGRLKEHPLLSSKLGNEPQEAE